MTSRRDAVAPPPAVASPAPSIDHGQRRRRSSRWSSRCSLGLFSNPYAGLVVFVALPAAVRARSAAHPARDVAAAPAAPARSLAPCATGRSSISGTAACARPSLAVIALTAVNIVIVLLAGYGALHWMESPSFCGQVCHTPMHPQFTAWQDAPHCRGRLRAVPHRRRRAGARPLQAGRRAAARPRRHQQLSAADPGVRRRHAAGARDLRHLPLRPRSRTASHPRVIRDMPTTKANTETATVLQMHVGGPGDRPRRGRAIHWHADPPCASSTSRPIPSGRRFRTCG